MAAWNESSCSLSLRCVHQWPFQNSVLASFATKLQIKTTIWKKQFKFWFSRFGIFLSQKDSLLTRPLTSTFSASQIVAISPKWYDFLLNKNTSVTLSTSLTALNLGHFSGMKHLLIVWTATNCQLFSSQYFDNSNAFGFCSEAIYSFHFNGAT